MNRIEPLQRECRPSLWPEIPRVFVVDNERSIRESLHSLILSSGWEPRTSATAEEFLAWPRMICPSCLVVELNLPGLSGLELQERVLDRTELPIIFMSGRADVTGAVQAMKAGAFEFLTKPLDDQTFVSAARSAIERSGGAIRDTLRIAALVERYESLSIREREVMSLLVAGRLNKQVGGALGIAEGTVKVHRANVMRKMRAGSLMELVEIAGSLRRPRAAC
jgi:FixJ family two-component response regulator